LQLWSRPPDTLTPPIKCSEAMARSVQAMLIVALAASARLAAAVSIRTSVTGGVTPVEKVIDLLGRLSVQIEEEGKAEAAQYDKYSCFCKEQADEKLYAIERSTSKLEELAAEMETLDSVIADLAGSIAELSKKITAYEDDIKAATEKRNAEHEVYSGKIAEVVSCIDAIKRAIKTIGGAKDDLEGNVQFDLAQLKSLARETPVATSVSVVKQQLSLLNDLVKGGQGQAPSAYTYHSNEITKTLELLLDTFKSTKQQLDMDEFDAKTVFEKKRLTLQHRAKAASKEKEENDKLSAMKSERLEEAKDEEAEEAKDKAADESFLKVLREGCEEKASKFDERSMTRSAELTAISQATEALKTGVVPNQGANKKLVGMSFLQLQGADAASKFEVTRNKVVTMLSKAGERLGSPTLSVAAIRVQTAEDHFKKVRSIIKDLIATLAAKASAEESHKQKCDEWMKDAISNRDTNQEKLETAAASIQAKTAQVEELEEEVAAISKAIAGNKKALKESLEVREEEKKENAKVLKDAGAGKEAVEFALTVLKKFYGGFIQQHSAYVPPDSDREGKTVGDLAPEIFEDKYEGKQSESKGIIGLLEVILADFERTDGTVSAEEQQAQEDYEAFVKKTNADTEEKDKLKSQKESEIINIKDELVDLKDKKAEAAKAVELAENELSTLKSSCVEGEETYEQRSQKRLAEIDALKQALAILENWNK